MMSRLQPFNVLMLLPDCHAYHVSFMQQRII